MGVSSRVHGESRQHTSNNRMWYEYEPMLLSSRSLRASTPEKVPSPFLRPRPSYNSASHSSSVVYPSYAAYIGGVMDYDYDIQKYKDGSPTLPMYRMTSLPSLYMRVSMRWTK